ncbi:MAG TPA: sialate O-acetylesterase [Thermoanaerobaculia bacterium]
MRLRFPLTLVSLALLAVVFAAAESSGSSLPTPDEVFVLAGQSNMLGRGLPLSKGAASDPRLLVWRKDGWQVAVDPLGNPKEKENGVGPGMTFGLGAIQTLAPATIGLVQCAVGGTTISKWEPPHSVYTNCIDQVNAAGGHIDGILFLQGESDAINSSDASNWAKRFKIVLTGFRTDLGADIPMVIGQIGKLSGYPYQQKVREQQAKAAAANPGVSMITTIDQKVSSDGVHFKVGSYKKIGTRFAAAWAVLRQIYP